MISTKTVVLLCFSLSVCLGATINNVDRVLQNLALQRSQHQASENLNLDEFLSHSAQFKEFVIEYEKEYESDDEIIRRFDIFRENLKEIETIQKSELGTAEYGVNKFADLSAEEFRYGLSPVNLDDIENLQLTGSFENYVSNVSENAKRINFLEKGKVLHKVQDQHLCGSCWAHAAVATIESANAIKNNNLVELSKQQVIDCDFYDDGCCGGWPFYAYEYIHHVGGIMEEKDYKQIQYESKCKFDKNKAKINVARYYIIYSQRTQYNVKTFESFMNAIGPLAAIINANGFRFYKGGILNQPNVICGKSTHHLNHAVLNIGYDVQVINGEEIPYWIIKNSWGPKWGENGYIRIVKGENVCGMEWIATGVQTA